ncbi:MAG: hypothetical protein D6800_06930 [Candidatus Zixiibacteriota bacterium]|nr:MAG: hypothetical protein D6800_06930 [candidate division Zixibacteria bacterium]
MSAQQQADELKTLLDSITTSYLRLGFDMADQWQSFARQNGGSFTDEQMRAAAGDFLKSQQPFFDAYKSMAHFSLGVIQSGNTFEPQTVDAFVAYVRFQDDLAAVISRPSGGPMGYRRKLEDFQQRQAANSGRLRDLLGR